MIGIKKTKKTPTPAETDWKLGGSAAPSKGELLSSEYRFLHFYDLQAPKTECATINVFVVGAVSHTEKRFPVLHSFHVSRKRYKLRKVTESRIHRTPLCGFHMNRNDHSEPSDFLQEASGLCKIHISLETLYIFNRSAFWRHWINNSSLSPQP